MCYDCAIARPLLACKASHIRVVRREVITLYPLTGNYCPCGEAGCQRGCTE